MDNCAVINESNQIPMHNQKHRTQHHGSQKKKHNSSQKTISCDNVNLKIVQQEPHHKPQGLRAIE